MNIENIIKKRLIEAIKNLYNQDIKESEVQIQNTRKDIEGDLTIVVFPLLRYTKKSPQVTAEELGAYLKTNVEEISEFIVIKGFLNLVISQNYWISFINSIAGNETYGFQPITDDSKRVVIEFSSPNTNKPLHLGHIRNNLIGHSLTEIMKANGNKVFKVNIVNDRGIHICKSMLAYQKEGKNETPETAQMKGDKLVGKYYVAFDKVYKAEIEELVKFGLKEDDAKKKAPSILEAQEMLRKWEAKDRPTIELWATMNGWVYKGFDETYRKLGVSFDKIYYESNTYILGKDIVQEGLDKGVLIKRADNSVIIDLTKDGLDEKVLLRSDGTSVYITQDMGTADLRHQDFNFDRQIYVVGNEQEYHFKVLFKAMEKLGYQWAKDCYHMSYGMVELPEGKMKSREGTVVDADDLIDEMTLTAEEMSKELGKLEGFSEEDKKRIFNTIGLGALKYFILKVDAKKNMLFNPKESIDFNGNTGPFIQYTYTRINSVLKKAKDNNIEIVETISDSISIDKKEIELLKQLYLYPSAVKEAGDTLTPSIIASYVYDVAKEYNQFYHDFQILKEENVDLRNFRILVSRITANVIKSGLALLGIDVPERM